MRVQKNSTYVKFITIGLIVLMLGGVVTISANFINDPKRPDDSYDSEAQDKYDDDAERYKDTTRVIRASGGILQLIGVTFLCLGMVVLGIYNKNLSPYVRLGLLIAAGLIIGLKFGGGGGNFISYYF